MDMKIYHDEDADLGVLKGKKIAVLGYGAQGRAQALCFRDSGLDVIVGVREGGASWNKAKEDGGMKVTTMDKAAAEGDVVMMLLPDEIQPEIYDKYVKDNLKSGAALEFAHGFSITYKLIVPPSTRAGTFAVDNFDQETKSDLFGEQAIECGGLSKLIEEGFNTLVKQGFPPIVAYFECCHECKLIIDLVVKGGMPYMWNVCSNTAKYGGLTRRDLIITDESVKGMQKVYDMIESGEFKKEWRAEYEQNHLAKLHALMDADSKTLLETTGKEVRALFERKN